MKKIAITVILCTLFFPIQAQENSVEKSIYGVQTGLLGVWGFNESRLSNEIALRTEVGFDLGLFDTFLIPGDVQTIWVPVISLEPRWYYNLDRRVRKGKSIVRNRANFLSLNVTYAPDIFVISSVDNINVPNQVSIIPTWGVRRTIGKFLSYETGFGIGYVTVLDNDIIGDKSDVAVNVHLRIGFDF